MKLHSFDLAAFDDAVRLARAFTPADYEVLLADPDQMSLFTPSIATIRTVLTKEPAVEQPQIG